ncbi:hypothetical protein ACFQ0D_31545 [Micromonospora zhanjiangensis]
MRVPAGPGAFDRTPVRLGAFAVGLALVFGATWGLGAADPVDTPGG